MKAAILWNINEPGLGLPGRIELVKSGSRQKKPSKEIFVLVETEAKDHQWTEKQDMQPSILTSPPIVATLRGGAERFFTSIDPRSGTLHGTYVVRQAKANQRPIKSDGGVGGDGDLSDLRAFAADCTKVSYAQYCRQYALAPLLLPSLPPPQR